MVGLFIVGLLVVGLWLGRTPLQNLVDQARIALRPLTPTPPTPAPPIADYQQTLQHIEAKRLSLAQHRFSHAESAHLLQHSLHDLLFPHWYGTLWSFNGTSMQPQKDSVACGYFVTNTLRAIGVELDRFTLAQMPSEQMIRQLIDGVHVERFSGVSFAAFERAVLAQGEGVYLVGLDDHTGFIWVDATGAYMIHSGGGSPYQVVKEPLHRAQKLVQSRYRVLGRLDQDPKFLQRWLAAPAHQS